jgi:hypothetical protein
MTVTNDRGAKRLTLLESEQKISRLLAVLEKLASDESITKPPSKTALQELNARKTHAKEILSRELQ